MTDHDIELTRRKILAGVGAVGAAGAGAGLGTSALFYEEESFANNAIAAGSLDLKVDWEEHYSFPQGEIDREDPEDTENVTRTEPSSTGGYRAFPPGITDPEASGNPLVWVDEEYVPTYMDATAIDAFPDPDNDGALETDVAGTDFAGAFDPDGQGGADIYYACADGADLEENLDPGYLRTDNADTRLDGEPAPLIHLQDVKPGDFGEVTLSTHLCDNDGYLWLQGALRDASENGVNDAEAASGEEDQVESDPAQDDPENPPLSDDDEDGEKDVELLEKTQTALWYDGNGNNLVDPEVGELDLVVAVDRSNSISTTSDDGLSEKEELIAAGNALAETVRDQVEVFGSDPDVQVGLLTFGGDINQILIKESLGSAEPFFNSDTSPGAPADLGQYIDDPADTRFEGNTPMGGALAAAQRHLNEGDEARSGAEKAILLVTDGGPTYLDDDGTTTISFPSVPGRGTETFTFDGTFDVDVDDDGTDEQVGLPGGGDFTEGSDTGTVVQDELNETELVANQIKATGTDILSVGILTDAEADAGNPESNLASGTTPSNLNTYLRERIASSPGVYFNTEFGVGGDVSDAATAIAEQITSGDEVFFTGTLGEALDELSGDGIPLDGSGDTSNFDELDDPEDSEDRGAFDASTTNYVGFSWWIPIEENCNEIQSDGVAFDLGFFAQQARNNDGESA